MIQHAGIIFPSFDRLSLSLSLSPSLSLYLSLSLSLSLSRSLLIPRLASLSRTRRSSFGKRSCSRSPPLSVSFDKQICRQCLRITTSFDSQLTVNSQSQGSLHYINGKLDYFLPPSQETELSLRHCRQTLWKITSSNHVSQ